MTNIAIAVGVNEYSFLRSLRYAARDARAMRDLLRGELGVETVFLFTKDSEPIATGQNKPMPSTPTYGALRGFLNRQFGRGRQRSTTHLTLNPGDNLWFFFAGHGLREGGHDYLMLSDSDPDDVERTALPVRDVVAQLQGSGADNVVMFVDACRNENTRDGTGIGEEHQGTIAFYSCAPEQRSYEIEEVQHGSFTYALMEAIRIQGMGNCATVERLAEHLKRVVPALNQQHGHGKQIPYLMLEPAEKRHWVLLPRKASPSDFGMMKTDAYRAETEGAWEKAERLWLRLNVLMGGSDMEVVRSLNRIDREKNSEPTPATVTQNDEIEASQVGTGVDLSQNDRKQLLSLLENMPEMRDERRRHQLLNDAGLGEMAGRIDVAGAPGVAAREVVDFLCYHGRESFAAFLETMRALVGKEKQKFLDLLREKYRIVGRQGVREVRSESPALAPVSEPESMPEASPGVSLQVFSFQTVRVNEKGEVVERKDGKAWQFVEDLGNGVKLEMVKIPGGKFLMGSPKSEKGRLDSESPQHEVTVPEFFMGRYAVTQTQWQAVMGSNPSGFKGANRPVENASWNDATEFCKNLSERTGREYRLPSEAEWEYACRAGTTTPFHFGATITAEIANYGASNTYASETKGEYRRQTTDAGSFPPNGFGLYDIHGNVWEWCADTWHDSYQDAPTDGSAWIDDKINNKDDDEKVNKYVLRGGSWDPYPRYCRSAFRVRVHPGGRDLDNGFRACCSPPRILP